MSRDGIILFKNFRDGIPHNGELSRPGHIAEHVVKTKYFRKPMAFEKPLAPPGRLERFVVRPAWA